MEIISNRESGLEFDAKTMSPVEPGVADEGVRFRTHEVIIENIWKNEFNGIYLSKLDNKVNDLLNGKDTTFNRLGSNPAAIRGLKEGSRIHVAASIIVQRGGSTSTETSIFGDEVGYQSLIQKDLIETWSRHNDCWVDNSTTYLENKYGKIVGYGSESRVFKDGEYAVKEWKVDRYESLQLALDRVTIHNAIFPETSMAIEGFGRTDSGNFVAIVRQPYIEGEALETYDELIDFMESRGFHEAKDDRYTNAEDKHTDYSNDDFFISDLHHKNILKYIDADNKAHYFVLDCCAYLNTPGLGKGGSHEIDEPESWAKGSEDDWKYPLDIDDDLLFHVTPAQDAEFRAASLSCCTNDGVEDSW